MLTEFKLPGLGENITSGVATKIMVKLGDFIKKDQMVLELETDKAVLEVPCPLSGIVKEILVKTGQAVKVGEPVIKIDIAATTTEPTLSTPLALTPTAPPQNKKAPPVSVPAKIEPVVEQPSMVSKDVPAAPSVRRFAREIGVDVAQVPGTGSRGRISIDDVKAYAKQILSDGARAAAGGTAVPQPLPDFNKWGAIEKQPLSSLRKKTAGHLSYAWGAIPHVTQFDKADITELEKLRKKFSAKAEQKGGRLTVTPFLLKVIASALKVFPQFNASIDLIRNEIIYKKYYHIGIAVDTDRGLIVPVIKDVDQKNLFDLTLELNQIAEKARNKKTTIEEMQGSSFTLTNLGGIGGTAFTPIINWPDVAILGVSRSSLEPGYVDGQLVGRLMLPLSLSYDHRLIDGADGARFLRWVCEAIQHPLLKELEG